jgi:hypothetical protein
VSLSPDKSHSDPSALLIKSFARVNKTALGSATGVLFGLGLFAATLILVAKGGDRIGPNLGLLSQFFKGYTVTLFGSFVGLFYGFVTGFALGWSVAFLRNLLVWIYLQGIRLKARLAALDEFIDEPFETPHHGRKN